MIERRFIRVAGPPGSGKTTLVEAVLGVSSETILVARCIRDDGLRHPRETSPPRDPELRRYLQAGAGGAARFAFPVPFPAPDAGFVAWLAPPIGEAFDAFYDTRLMSNSSDAVILEGDDPLGHPGLDVFVAPAPEAGEALFVRQPRDRAAAERARADAWEELLRQPDGVARWMDQMMGGPVVEYVRRNTALAETVRDQMLAGIANFRDAPPVTPVEHWAVADRYRGIEHAGLVVVNVHDPSERCDGERLVADILRLRQDRALFDDILGWRGHRTPITAVVADLTEPRDPGRRKALARLRRSLRAR
jgi:energy-coupling factor transporter ATP-binding protein EcfA2